MSVFIVKSYYYFANKSSTLFCFMPVQTPCSLGEVSRPVTRLGTEAFHKRRCNKTTSTEPEIPLARVTCSDTALTTRLSTRAGRSAGPQARRAPLCACAAEDFLRVCDRRVTEPALLSDDQLSACALSFPLSLSLSLSLSLLSDPLFLSHPSLSSHRCSISVSDSAQYPPQHPLPLSTAERAKHCRPPPPHTLSVSRLLSS